MQTRKGQEIEDESMQIIESEIGSHTFNEMEWPIVRRIIHSTADFDFARENKLLFHKDAISNGINALKNGCSIVTDVNGVIGLMNKQNPKDFGNNLICNISDPSLMESAKKAGKTRAQMSMRVAEKEIDALIKKMSVEEMNKMMFQTIMTLANSYEKATSEDQLANAMRDFAEFFGEKTEIIPRSGKFDGDGKG